MLREVRMGQCSEETLNLLQSRKISPPEDVIPTVQLMSRKADVYNHNFQMLHRRSQQVITIPAIDLDTQQAAHPLATTAQTL